MTPAEHYERGEALLARAEQGNPAFNLTDGSVIVTAALAHFTAALAGELGVPTTVPTAPPAQPPPVPPAAPEAPLA